MSRRGSLRRGSRSKPEPTAEDGIRRVVDHLRANHQNVPHGLLARYETLDSFNRWRSSQSSDNLHRTHSFIWKLYIADWHGAQDAHHRLMEEYHPHTYRLHYILWPERSHDRAIAQASFEESQLETFRHLFPAIFERVRQIENG